ncbi:MAG: hypothetical protein AAGM67_15105, partial [Bacteroidota bacterium]
MFYEDIIQLVSPGFLHHDVQIYGTHVSLRSLYPSDIYMVGRRTGRNITERQWRQWMVASSVWVVDGYQILCEKHRVNRIFENIRKLPDVVLNVLYYQVLGLINRVNTAIEGVQIFAFENTSRILWQQCGRGIPNRDAVTGIEGVEKLGLNAVQKIWMLYNQVEDQSENEFLDWERAKLIASASAPKGVEKLNNRDQRQRDIEKEKREDLLDYFFYSKFGLLLERDLHHRSELQTVRKATS